MTLTVDPMTTIYRKRWNVEPYHKSLKQNASLEKSPTQTVTTQSNHLFAALCAYIKLEVVAQSHQTQSLCAQNQTLYRSTPFGLCYSAPSSSPFSLLRKVSY